MVQIVKDAGFCPPPGAVLEFRPRHPGGTIMKKWAEKLRAFLNRQSLLTKVTLLFGAGLVLTTLVLCMFFVALLQRQIRAEIQNLGSLQAQTIASSSWYPVTFQLKEQLDGTLRGLEQHKDFVYGEFLDEQHKLLAKTGGGEGRPDVFAQYDGQSIRNEARMETARGRDGSPHLIFTRPILQEVSTGEWKDNQPVVTYRVVGEVRLVFSLTRIARERNLLLLSSLAIFLVLAAAGVPAVHFLAKIVIRPLKDMNHAVEQIAEGDLTRRVALAARDEVADLGQSVNTMADKLETVIGRIQEGNSRLGEVAAQVRHSSDRMSEGVNVQAMTFEEISSSIEEMNRSIQSIADSVDELSASSQETSASIMQMAATIEEVSKSTESLTDSVNESSATTTQMVRSIKEIDQNVETLTESVFNTMSTVEEMDGSIRQVEQAASQSNSFSQTVSEKAQKGKETVGKTIRAMESIRAMVTESSQKVLQLGRHSQEIGKIVNVIEDIAEQTNLLALNAAIIAAQAGEEGKGFAVVADEIRELAERTASSTKDIADLIASVQEHTDGTIKFIKQGAASVEEGVALARESGGSLEDMLRSAVQSSEMANLIARATKEQIRSSQSIRDAVQRVHHRAEEIRKATREQAQGSELILRSLQHMSELTSQVKRATVEQHQGSQLITGAVALVTEKISHIQSATSQQAKGSQQILLSLEKYNEIIEASRRSVEELQEVVEVLNGQAKMLEGEILKFRLRGRG
jgi:methyl-accepting chemotaxis protein